MVTIYPVLDNHFRLTKLWLLSHLRGSEPGSCIQKCPFWSLLCFLFTLLFLRTWVTISFCSHSWVLLPCTHVARLIWKTPGTSYRSLPILLSCPRHPSSAWLTVKPSHRGSSPHNLADGAGGGRNSMVVRPSEFKCQLC